MRIMGARKNTNINNFAMKNNKGNPVLIDIDMLSEKESYLLKDRNWNWENVGHEDQSSHQ